MNSLNAYIPGKELPSYKCTLPSNLLLLPHNRIKQEWRHVCAFC